MRDLDTTEFTITVIAVLILAVLSYHLGLWSASLTDSHRAKMPVARFRIIGSHQEGDHLKVENIDNHVIGEIDCIGNRNDCPDFSVEDTVDMERWDGNVFVYKHMANSGEGMYRNYTTYNFDGPNL
jgi:hypothetical protein